MQKAMRRKPKSARQAGAGAVLRHTGAAALCCMALLCALTAAFAQLACRLELPLYLLTPLSTAALCLAVLPSAMLLAWLQGKNGLLCGTLFALGVFFLLWGAAAVRQGQGALGELGALKALALAAAGALGGYAGISARERGKRPH